MVVFKSFSLCKLEFINLKAIDRSSCLSSVSDLALNVPLDQNWLL